MVVVVVVPRCLSRGVVLLLHYSGDLKESFSLSKKKFFFFFGDVGFRVLSVFFFVLVSNFTLFRFPLVVGGVVVVVVVCYPTRTTHFAHLYYGRRKRIIFRTTTTTISTTSFY